jgi:phosphatidylserine decarboxylase
MKCHSQAINITQITVTTAATKKAVCHFIVFPDEYLGNLTIIVVRRNMQTAPIIVRTDLSIFECFLASCARFEFRLIDERAPRFSS